MSRVEISKRLVLINTGSAILTRVISVSVVLSLNAFLLRRIDPKELQLLPLLLSIVVLLPLFTSFLTTGLGRFMLTAYAQGDDRGVTRIASTMFPLLLAAGGIILLGGLVLAWHIDQVLVIPPERLWEARIMMALLVVSTATKLPCMVFSIGFYIHQRFVLANVVGLCSEFLRITLLAVLLFGVRTSVLSVVTANVVTELTVTFVMMILSLRMLPALRFRRREIRWSCARELVSFGGWNFLGYMAYRMRETLILMILNRQATPLDVTVFNVGYQGRRQIDAWTDLLAGPLYPVVTGMHALGAKDRIRSIYLRGGRVALWVMLLVALPAAIYAKTVIHLYATEPYMEAAVVMVVTLAGLPVMGGAWMIWQVSNATGRVRAVSLYVLLMQAAVVGLSFYVVHGLGWGATGVALACLVVGIVVEVLFLCPLGLKLAGATFDAWTRETLIPGLTPGCVAGVVWAGLNVIVQPSGWVGLGVCTAAGVLCYLTVLLAFCLEPRDREDLAVLIAKFKNIARFEFGVARQVSAPVARGEPGARPVSTESPRA
jgi:O-antigen/teichoic acid export membrane protein